MAEILKNIAIMILSVAVLIGGGYLVLVVLGWGLKRKGGYREQQGLTDLWAEVKREQTNQDKSEDHKSEKSE